MPYGLGMFIYIQTSTNLMQKDVIAMNVTLDNIIYTYKCVT